jgi:hypothetical protein
MNDELQKHYDLFKNTTQDFALDEEVNTYLVVDPETSVVRRCVIPPSSSSSSSHAAGRVYLLDAGVFLETANLDLVPLTDEHLSRLPPLAVCVSLHSLVPAGGVSCWGAALAAQDALKHLVVPGSRAYVSLRPGKVEQGECVSRNSKTI